MRVMNKKQKQKFAEATDRVADLVGEEGEDPEDAILKVAEENDYGRYMTENLARSFNIGVSWHQIEKSGSLEEKLMEAPVVRSDRLGQEVSDVDEDNQIRKAAHMDELNGLQKDYIAEQNREENPLRKVASEVRKNREDNSPRESDLLKHYRKCAKLKEDLDLKINSFGNRWKSHMERAAEAVRECDEDNHEVLKRASVALPEYGDQYVAMLAEHMGDDEFAENLQKSGMKQFYMVDDEQPPYCYMKEGVELMDEADQYDRARDEIISEMKKVADIIDYDLPGLSGIWKRETEGPTAIERASKMQDANREATESARRGYQAAKERHDKEKAEAGVPATIDDVVTALVPTGQGDGGEETALSTGEDGGTTHYVRTEVVDPAQDADTTRKSWDLKGKGKRLAKGIADWLKDKKGPKGKPKKKDKGDSRISKLVDNITETAENLASGEAEDLSLPASHEREINQLYSTATLNRMLSSDPVLSERPEETVNMFNRVMEINPFIARHPQVATSMTRRLVEASGRLDPSEISDLEDSIGDALKHLGADSSSS